MSLQSRDDLIDKLRSKKFRDAFVSSRVSNTLALQIRAMRQERGWSQAQLAELLGTSQNAVWRLESPQYGKASITTLKRLASIFDVGLAVWFVPFSDLVNRFTNLLTESIVVPSFENDPGLSESAIIKISVSDTINVNVKEETLINIHDPLEQKALGIDRLSGSFDQTEKLRKFLRSPEYDNVILFPKNLPQTTQHEETGYAAVGNFPR